MAIRGLIRERAPRIKIELQMRRSRSFADTIKVVMGWHVFGVDIRFTWPLLYVLVCLGAAMVDVMRMCCGLQCECEDQK